MTKESQARLKINKLLEDSGWVLVSTDEKIKNVDTEPKVKIEDNGSNGFIDYLLLDKKGFPLVVVEAKRYRAGYRNAGALSKHSKHTTEKQFTPHRMARMGANHKRSEADKYRQFTR